VSLSNSLFSGCLLYFDRTVVAGKSVKIRHQQIVGLTNFKLIFTYTELQSKRTSHFFILCNEMKCQISWHIIRSDNEYLWSWQWTSYRMASYVIIFSLFFAYYQQVNRVNFILNCWNKSNNLCHLVKYLMFLKSVFKTYAKFRSTLQ